MDHPLNNHYARIRADFYANVFLDMAEITGYVLLAVLSWKAAAGVALVLWALRGRLVS